MSFGVRVRIWGDRACFTRPEMKVERVSYEVLTPSAARGILEAIYWNTEIRWIIDRIHVLKPIRFENILRNELENKISVSQVKSAMIGNRRNISTFIEEKRQQRASLVLKDVAYVIDAHFTATKGERINHGKHKEIFKKRVGRGRCFSQPYLGTREFSAFFTPVNKHERIEAISETRDLGLMLYDLDFSNPLEIRPKFFWAFMQKGVINIPQPESDEVLCDT